ncbi:MAG: Superfamily or helicase, family [Planctomycetaceae bacterium]|nr:Superfamily or helicase, family [Planctomycetaceae bacterium]
MTNRLGGLTLAAASVSAGRIPIHFRPSQPLAGSVTSDPEMLRLHLKHASLKLLRDFDQLLCLEGLHGVEHLPHQIETVRKVLRHFRGRVLLADEVGLGKTIEACLLLREYLLRGLARRVLILVPAPLVSQWEEELRLKFGLEFTVASHGAQAEQPDFWTSHDRVLTSLSLAKSGKRAEQVAAAPWDLVIVDEAHHCKNRTTKNWQLINSLQRRHMFLLTATPVQNNLIELYNLLTLLEPGHLRTEVDFKKQYIQRGNPRDPRNRERLRSLLGEVMIRNTRSLVQMNLPPRYAQTIQARPGQQESQLYTGLAEFLRERMPQRPGTNDATVLDSTVDPADIGPTAETGSKKKGKVKKQSGKPLTRMQLSALLAAQGSHPAALRHSLEGVAEIDPQARRLVEQAESITRSAKDDKLLELIEQSRGHKILIFVNFLRTMHRLQELFKQIGISFTTFSGEQTSAQKDQAVADFRDGVPVMLCTDSGGEGRNLQFADTLVNYDLPWNPMQIEQRIGRVHRIGQTREVFVFNLCTAGSVEERILKLLHEKIRMFELVVGEVGSILGNLEDGEEFETLVLNLWLKAGDDRELDDSFDALGHSLLDAQKEYLETKELDEALFGDDFE